MGDETRQNLTLRGLQSAAGFLQAKIAEPSRSATRRKLSFLLDQGVKRVDRRGQILRQVLPRGADGRLTTAAKTAGRLAYVSARGPAAPQADPTPVTREPSSMTAVQPHSPVRQGPQGR